MQVIVKCTFFHFIFVEMVVMVMGLPGSGKSFLAERLAEALGADHLSSDVVRQDLLKQRTYSDEERLQVYHEMDLRLRQLLSSHRNVVLDATFYSEEIRSIFRRTAEDLEVKLSIIQVTAPEHIIRERVSAKREYSEADYSVYLIIKNEFEEPSGRYLELDTSDLTPEEMISKSLKFIGE